MGSFVQETLDVPSQSTFFTVVHDIFCDVSDFLFALNPMIQP